MTTTSTSGVRAVMKKLAFPLALLAGISAYVLVAGKLGTCPACVAVTDALFGPAEPSAAAQTTGPSWSFPDLQGGTLSSESLRGDVNVVAFWATWCPPCREEIPALNEISSKFGDRGLNVIGVSVDEDPDDALAGKVNRLGIRYPVVRGDAGIPGLFGEIRAIPTIVVFSRDNEIAFRHTGVISADELETEILKLL